MGAGDAGPSEQIHMECCEDIEMATTTQSSEVGIASDLSQAEIPEGGLTVNFRIFKCLSLNMKKVWMSLRPMWAAFQEHRAEFLAHKTEVNHKLDLILEALGRPISTANVARQVIQESPNDQEALKEQHAYRLENLRPLNSLDVVDIWKEWTVGVPIGGSTLEAPLKELEAAKDAEKYKDARNKGLKTAVMRRRHIVEHLETKIAELRESGLAEEAAEAQAIENAEKVRLNLGKGGKKVSLYSFWKHIRDYK